MSVCQGSAFSPVPNPSLEQAPPLVELRGISKCYGQVRANSNINLSIRAGRVKALLGENGAGKSTLMSILSGRILPDEGTVFIEGTAQRFQSPKDAHVSGIGMVYQHFMLVESMTVTENVLLGHESSFLLKPEAMRSKVAELAALYGLEIDPRARVGSLSMGERQRVEILKLLCRESRVLIFDEPTAVLTPKEAEQLFEAMRKMAALQKAIVFISHKLPEVLAIADEVAILRRGEVVDEFSREHVPDEAELARRMLGRDLRRGAAVEEPGGPAGDLRLVMGELPLERPRKRGKALAESAPVLRLADLCAPGVEKVSFALAKGQVLAVLGVAGNGQKELVEMICGLNRPVSGSLSLLGLDWRCFFREQRTQGGLAYVPEDRRGTASCPQLSLVDNFLLTTSKLFSRYGLLDRKRALRATKALIADYKIYPGLPQAKGQELSGGNLQKLIVGRELLHNPGLIVAENPTQGLDVAATEEVWQRLRIAKSSSGILLVTGDVNEALTLADYVAVMYRGRVMDLFSTEDQSKVEHIGLLMAGVAR